MLFHLFQVSVLLMLTAARNVGNKGDMNEDEEDMSSVSLVSHKRAGLSFLHMPKLSNLLPS